MTQEEGGHNMSTGQGSDTIEGMDLSTTSTQLKRLHVMEQSIPRKKAKASKLDIQPITLTEGDLYDIGDTVIEVT